MKPTRRGFLGFLGAVVAAPVVAQLPLSPSAPIAVAASSITKNRIVDNVFQNDPKIAFVKRLLENGIREHDRLIDEAINGRMYR